MCGTDARPLAQEHLQYPIIRVVRNEDVEQEVRETTEKTVPAAILFVFSVTSVISCSESSILRKKNPPRRNGLRRRSGSAPGRPRTRFLGWNRGWRFTLF